jgi:Tfp pilus assembly protein PilO
MAGTLNMRPGERRLLVAVALVLFVVVNIWFVWPHFGDLQQARNKRAAALKTLARYNEEIGKKAEREAEVKRLESVGSNVGRQDQAIELLRAIQQTASAHGVVPTGQSRPSTRTNEFFIEQSQNVTMLTGESELLDILYDLGSGNSTIRVRDLTVRPDPQRYKLSSNIKLVSSYRADTPAGKRKPRPPTTAKK